MYLGQTLKELLRYLYKILEVVISVYLISMKIILNENKFIFIYVYITLYYIIII